MVFTILMPLALAFVFCMQNIMQNAFINLTLNQLCTSGLNKKMDCDILLLCVVLPAGKDAAIFKSRFFSYKN